MTDRRRGDALYEAELREFDLKPDSAHISLKAAASIANVSMSTLRRQIDQGAMPPIVKLGAKKAGLAIGPFREALAARLQQAAGPSTATGEPTITQDEGRDQRTD
jgi:hypothetical protein